ncbi:MAG: efflux RND transporter periplasmic adaptor subunit [Myxococcales bacterium]|nr:efflux RND transporter periplasmic adaptor subunit [Myxococcales bacterium]
MRRRPTLWVALALGAVAAVGLFVRAGARAGDGSGAPKESAQAKTRADAADIKHVVTAVVTRRALPERLAYAGITRGTKRALLSFTVGGRLVSRPVRVGDRVRRGQLLARLDAAAYVNQSSSARALLGELDVRIGQLERDQRRVRALSAQGAATQEEREKVEAGLRALRAKRDAARVRQREAGRALREAHLSAPFAGVVTRVFVERGETVGGGRPVIALSGAAIEVEIELPGSAAARFRADAKVSVDLPLLGRRGLEARVTSFGASGSPLPGRLFPVIVTLAPAPGVVAGLAAEVHVTLGGEPQLVAPIEAVVDPSGRDASVFRVRGGVAERVPVDVLRLGDGEVSLRVRGRSLGVGDEVIVEGQLSLLDGDRVVVRARQRMASHRSRAAR